MIKYKIVLGEPYDFEGPNPIVGEVIKQLSPRCLLFKCDTVLKIGKNTGQILLLKPRSVGQDLTKDGEVIVCDFKNGILAGTMGHLVLVDDYMDQDEQFLIQHSEYIIIGSITIDPKISFNLPV